MPVVPGQRSGICAKASHRLDQVASATTNATDMTSATRER